MGLHNEVLYGWKNIVIWYQAVNERGGRLHLWSVPAYQHDKTALRENQSARFSYYREELLEKNFLGFNAFRDSDPLPGSRRMCNTRQTVYKWSRVYDWSSSLTPSAEPTSPRGWCKTCWEIYLTHYDTIVQDSFRFYGYISLPVLLTEGPLNLRALGQSWQEEVNGRG